MLASLEQAEETTLSKLEAQLKLYEIVADAPLAVEFSEELLELEEGSEVLKQYYPRPYRIIIIHDHIGSSTF